jgi:hypothetical protein
MLSERGLADPTALDVYRLTQLAAGRHVLAGKGPQPSDVLFRFDRHGDLRSEERLSANEIFRAATTLMPLALTRPAAEVLALSSSEVQAVHAALENGSKPENLKLAPCVFFDQEPTPQALEKAQRFLGAWLRGEAPQSAVVPRPWWRRW